MKEQTTTDTYSVSEPQEDSAQYATPPALRESYRFIRKLGQGSQAKVFLAERLTDKCSVVVKQLDIESVSNWKEYDLFHREAEVLESLHIDGVARFYDTLEFLEDTPPRSYIVQEYIEGASLGEMLRSNHRFSTDEVYDIIIQMLSILFQLQNRPVPVIHRDIKPNNIMLTPQDNGGYKVTLIDFGAVANPQVQSGGSTIAGTFGYMPPEQLMGRPTPSSDIYALGAVAVELFSGISPADLPVKDFRLIFEPQMQNQPPALVATLRQMLETSAEDRFCDIPLLVQRFTDYRNGKFGMAKSVRREDKEYQDKLLKVADIGAPGNLDLWQALSESVPRTLPMLVTDSAKIEIEKANRRIRRLVICSILAGIILSIFMCFSQNHKLFLFVFMLCGFVVSLRHAQKLFRKKAQMLPQTSDISATGREDASDNPASMKYRLLMGGIKTLATVVDISYEPANERNVEDKVVRKTDDSKNIELLNIMICRSLPNFRIKYKFNPPDDARDDDLINSCIVHDDAAKHLKVGDPLPILYKVEGTGFDEKVISMVFPYPQSDCSDADIIDVSCNEKAFENLAKEIEESQMGSSDKNVLLSVLEARAKLYELRSKLSGFGNIICTARNADYIRKLMTYFLNNQYYTPIHELCLCTLIQLYDSSSPVSEPFVDIVLDYLNRHRSFKQIGTILTNHYTEQMPERFWEKIQELCMDASFANQIRNEIAQAKLTRLSIMLLNNDHEQRFDYLYDAIIEGLLQSKTFECLDSILVALRRRPVNRNVWNKKMFSLLEKSVFVEEESILSEVLKIYFDTTDESIKRDIEALNGRFSPRELGNILTSSSLNIFGLRNKPTKTMLSALRPMAIRCLWRNYEMSTNESDRYTWGFLHIHRYLNSVKNNRKKLSPEEIKELENYPKNVSLEFIDILHEVKALSQA